MNAVLSYVWRKSHQSPPVNGDIRSSGTSALSPCTPQRRAGRSYTDTKDTGGDTFMTPDSPLPDNSGKRDDEPTSMQLPALFSPLVPSGSQAAKLSTNNKSAAVPVTPEGLRPRPTVSEMRTILGLDPLDLHVPPPPMPPPASWIADSTNTNLTTPDSKLGIMPPSSQYAPTGSPCTASVEHQRRRASEPPISDLACASVNSNQQQHLSMMSALTYSPAQQQHQPRCAVTANHRRTTIVPFSSPPISFGSPSFFATSVSRGVQTTSPAAIASEHTGIASSPNLTTSGAKTAVGLLVAESFDGEETDSSAKNSHNGVLAAAVSTPQPAECTGIASSPNLTMSGAKTAVGLVVARSFNRDDSGGSSSRAGSSTALTEVGALVAVGGSARPSPQDAGMKVLPPKDDNDDSSVAGGSCWFSPRDPGPAARRGKPKQAQMEQPTTISHAPSDASSLYEEEGERLRQKTSSSVSAATLTPQTNRSKSTDQTPSTAGRTWEHYQQYYEDEEDESDNEECEYTALHKPMLELHGSVDVSKDISFSSRQGFLAETNDNGRNGDQSALSNGSGRDGAYDFGRLDGIGPKSLASLDGSSIRPVPSLEGGACPCSNDENVGDLGNLPMSPPSLPGHLQHELNSLPLSPPSLPNGSQQELNALPRSPPGVPGSSGNDRSNAQRYIASDADIDAKYQHRQLNPRRRGMDVSHIVVGPSHGALLNDTNVSALSHGTGMTLIDGDNNAWSALDATITEAFADDEHSIDSVETHQDKYEATSTTSHVDADLNGATVRDGQAELGEPQSEYAIDGNLIRRKRRNQSQAAKQRQLKGLVERLRDASEVVMTVCITKGLLGQAEISLLSGYEAKTRDNILAELDSLLSFIFGDDDTRESIRFVLSLVESAPEMSPRAKDGESSAVDTPRSMPLIGSARQDSCWRANDMLMRALGIGGYASPNVVRGGDTSLFSLPTNSTTPNVSNQSMATTITSVQNSSQSDKSLTTASRRLRLAAEAVVLLLQQISAAADRLPDERSREDTVWAASVEEIKRTYHRLMRIPNDDISALEDAFILHERTPMPSEKQQHYSAPPAIARGSNATTQQITAAKWFELGSPDEARVVDGEITNPPIVIRSVAAFEKNSSPRPVVPTVSEEPENSTGDSGDDIDEHDSHVYEDDDSEVDTSNAPRDLLTSFEDEADDSDDCNSELTPHSPLHEEESSNGGDGDDERENDTYMDEDLRRLRFDTSATYDHVSDERDGPSRNTSIQEMSV